MHTVFWAHWWQKHHHGPSTVPGKQRKNNPAVEPDAQGTQKHSLTKFWGLLGAVREAQLFPFFFPFPRRALPFFSSHVSFSPLHSATNTSWWLLGICGVSPLPSHLWVNTCLCCCGGPVCKYCRKRQPFNVPTHLNFVTPLKHLLLLSLRYLASDFYLCIYLF